MALGDDAPLLVRMQQRGDSRHEESCLDPMAVEKLHNARYSDAVAVLTPGHSADRLATVAKFVCLMVAVEGQGHGASRPAFPRLRAKASTRPHLVDEPAPVLFRPLPRLLRLSFGHSKNLLDVHKAPSLPPRSDNIGSCRYVCRVDAAAGKRVRDPTPTSKLRRSIVAPSVSWASHSLRLVPQRCLIGVAACQR